MKYVDENEKVRMLIAERHPFKGVENYFTDSLLCQDSLEADENPQPEESDYGNEADVEPEAEEEYLWELNPPVTSVNKLMETRVSSSAWVMVVRRVSEGSTSARNAQILKHALSTTNND